MSDKNQNTIIGPWVLCEMLKELHKKKKPMILDMDRIRRRERKYARVLYKIIEDILDKNAICKKFPKKI